MAPRALAALLLALLAVGSARADAIRAEGLLLEGPILLGDDARLEGRPLALFLNATERVRAFTATFSYVVVYVFEENGTVVPGASFSPFTDNNTRHVFRDVEVTMLAGDAAGYLGYYPGDEGRLALDLVPGSLVSATAGREYGNIRAGTSGGAWEAPLFTRPVDAAHVASIEAGVVLLEGPGALKVLGLDLAFRSPRGDLDVATGDKRTPYPGPLQPVEDRKRRWVVLDFPDGGEVQVDSASPFEVAVDGGLLSWSGRATLRPREAGALRLGEEVPQAGEAVHLVGDFRALLEAERGNGGAALRIDLEGEGAAAGRTLTQRPTRAWLPLALVALAAVAAVGGLLAYRARRGQVFSLDEMLTLAHLAGEAGRHDEALSWIRRARASAPSSGALALEEAFHLGELGQVQEALARYGEAATLLDDGQAELDAALLGLRTGALPDAEVERLLVLALDKDPGLVLELEEEETAGLARLPGRLALAAALARARRRLDSRE